MASAHQSVREYGLEDETIKFETIKLNIVIRARHTAGTLTLQDAPTDTQVAVTCHHVLKMTRTKTAADRIATIRKEYNNRIFKTNTKRLRQFRINDPKHKISIAKQRVKFNNE